MSGPGEFSAGVKCTYMLSSQKLPYEKWVEQTTGKYNGKVTKTDQLQIQNLTIHWSLIEGPISAFLAAAELPNNRSINIEVIQATYELNIAEKVFKKILKTLNYNVDNSIKTGNEIVSEIKSKGIDTFTKEDNEQSCFFITDSRNRNIGFTIDLFYDSNSADQSNIRAATQLYMGGFRAQEQVTLFQSDNHLQQYTWNSETNTRNGRTGTEIVLDESGTINVTTETDRKPERINYDNGSGIIPGIFLEPLINHIVQNNIQQAVVDTIEASGNITPMLISVDPNSSNTERAKYIVTLDFMDGTNISEQVYLNEEKQITKIILQQDRIYIFQRTDLESIAKEFPDQAMNISQISEAL